MVQSVNMAIAPSTETPLGGYFQMILRTLLDGHLGCATRKLDSPKSMRAQYEHRLAMWAKSAKGK